MHQYHLNYYGNDYPGIAEVSPSVNVATQLGTDYRLLLNGNISSIAMNIGKLQNPLPYNYHYDQLTRLTAMDAEESTVVLVARLRSVILQKGSVMMPMVIF